MTVIGNYLFNFFDQGFIFLDFLTISSRSFGSQIFRSSFLSRLLGLNGLFRFSHLIYSSGISQRFFEVILVVYSGIVSFIRSTISSSSISAIVVIKSFEPLREFQVILILTFNKSVYFNNFFDLEFSESLL